MFDKVHSQFSLKMKCAVVLSSLLLIHLSSALPLIDEAHRWELTPDSSGRMHLVDLKPFETPIEPSFNPASDIVFLVFTRSNPTVGQRIFLNNQASVQNSNFNPAHPTRVTIHGWQGSLNDAVNIEVTAAYLRHGDYNMVIVDWSVGASSINYITSRNHVGNVGLEAARMIDFLHSIGHVRFPDLHVIGHSLGGHAVGHAGKSVTRGRIQVVYALDPAGPLFYLNDPANRVDASDGVHVEAMFTNSGTQGFTDPLGQANFFPNFGRSQPGCGIDLAGTCAHARCVLFYAESINTPFTSHECNSFDEIRNGQCTRTGRTAQMGGPRGNVGLTGHFHLTTNAAAPFSQG